MTVKLLGSILLLALARPAAGQQGYQAPDVHFVPTPMEVVESMLAVTRVSAGDVVYDLGSGDGRIVITAASRHQARGVGIDIDPERIKESRRNADSAGVKGQVTFRQADLFKTDLREANVVTLYLLPTLNLRLRPKLFRELEPGSRIASNAFDMGDWKPDSVVEVPGKMGGSYNVYYWLIPADLSGEWVLTTGDERSTLTLEQRFQELSGTAAFTNGRAPLDQGRVKGDSVMFTLRGERYVGTVSGGTAKGTASGGDANREWTATRKAKGKGPVPPDTTEG